VDKIPLSKKTTNAATANLILAANKPRPKDLSYAQSAPDFADSKKLVGGLLYPAYLVYFARSLLQYRIQWAKGQRYVRANDSTQDGPSALRDGFCF
jgi:hypothetical protein